MRIRNVLKSHKGDSDEFKWLLESYDQNPIRHLAGIIGTWLWEWEYHTRKRDKYDDISEAEAFAIDPKWKPKDDGRAPQDGADAVS